MSSPIREIEVNVVSSPESTSRNNSPEPDSYRLINHSTPNITCFPLIKTSSDDGDKIKDKDNIVVGKATTATQKSAGGSTNFSISSILSRTEPTAKKLNSVGVNNNYSGVQSGHNILETGLSTTTTDNAVLSR